MFWCSFMEVHIYVVLRALYLAGSSSNISSQSQLLVNLCLASTFCCTQTRTATPGMHISIYQICTASGVLIYVIYNLLDFELDPDEDIQSDHYIYLRLYKRDACMRDN